MENTDNFKRFFFKTVETNEIITIGRLLERYTFVTFVVTELRVSRSKKYFGALRSLFGFINYVAYYFGFRFPRRRYNFTKNLRNAKMEHARLRTIIAYIFEYWRIFRMREGPNFTRVFCFWKVLSRCIHDPSSRIHVFNVYDIYIV